MSARNVSLVVMCGILLPIAVTTQSHAQQPAGADTVRLEELYDAARRSDGRAVQLELLAGQTSLRLRNLEAARLPALSAHAHGQYQSDVASIPFQLPGVTMPIAPNDTYDAHVAARQMIYDPELGARRAVERAKLAESQARVQVSRYQVRSSVDEAYFTALLLQAQAAEVTAAIAALEAQLHVAAERVREGAALPSEAATLDAALLRRRQTLDELATGESAARQVLGELTGRTIADADALALPDLADDVAAARAALGQLRARPEYEQFARGRELLDRQRASVSVRNLPRVSAHGRAGYGRPGLNPLASEFGEYWLTGIQVEWTPWTWRSTQREREVLALQQQIVTSDEATFTDALRRAAVTELAGIDRLERALEADTAIIALREQILGEAQLRFAEGVITSAEYVDRETDVLDARLALVAHRVELSRARARFLTLSGVEIR